MQTQDEILARHPNDIMVKIDEDVFVVPNWLDEMFCEYKKIQKEGCILVSALVPNNQPGMRMLHEAYQKNFLDYSKFTDDLFNTPISKNPRYALRIWKKFMQGKLDLTQEGLLKNVGCKKMIFTLILTA